MEVAVVLSPISHFSPTHPHSYYILEEHTLIILNMSRHGIHDSVLLMASFATLQRQKPYRNMNRSETNTTTDVNLNLDNQSLRTVDQLSTARASATMLDKLWTQIDVLDDVKKMAQEVQERGSFLSEEFSEKLIQMKEAQQRLLDVMGRHHELSEKSRQEMKEQLEQTPIERMEEEAIRKDNEAKQKKMHDFFFGNERENTNEETKDFDELNDYVDDVRQNLAAVAKSMAKFDDTTKDLW